MTYDELIVTLPEWQKPLFEAWHSIPPEQLKDDSERMVATALQTWPVFLKFNFYINTGPLFDWCSEHVAKSEWIAMPGGVWAFKNASDAMKAKLLFSGYDKK